MLLFEFDGPLFAFRAKTPAFVPLFQFPSRIRAALWPLLLYMWGPVRSAFGESSDAPTPRARTGKA